MDMNNINAGYLLNWCLDNGIECDDEDRVCDLIIDSAAFPESYLYSFDDIEYEFDIIDYSLHDKIYDERIKQDIYVYETIVDEIKDGFMAQTYNIREVGNPLTVRFCVFLSDDVVEDKILYKYMLGHELAHIDLFDLPKYDKHYNQYRYVITEAYCDVKSLEGMEDLEERQAVYDMIMEDISSIGEIDEVRNIRESEIRRCLMREFMKGRITSKDIYKYIIDNYDRHMKYLDDVKDEHMKLMEHYLFKDELPFAGNESQAAYDLKGKIARELLDRFYI
jgi:hypothetical protein